MGKNISSGKPEVEEPPPPSGHYRKVRDSIEVKEIVVGDREARQRVNMVRNPEMAERDRKNREEIIATVEEEPRNLRHAPEGQHTKTACALCSHPTRYLRQLKNDRLCLDWP